MTNNHRKEKVVWITVSHPEMSIHDTIGDMVRLKTISNVFQMADWDSKIVVCHDDRAAALETPGSIKSGLKRHVVPLKIWNSLKDCKYIRNNSRSSRFLDNVPGPPPDLIVDYNFYLSDAALRYAKKHNVPIIMNYEALPWDCMEGPGKSFLKPWGEYFERKKYLKYDAIWVVSEPLKDELRRFIGSSRPPIQVLPNATTPDMQRPEGLPRGEGGSVCIGFVGGLSAWYALDRLIVACDRIKAKGRNISLIIVGDGPEYQRLEAIIRDRCSTDWCRLAGKISHSEIWKYLQLFDIGVITNHKWWTSPLKLLEYGLFGLAVIAPDLRSITSMASPRECQFFKHEDFADFEEKLTSLIDNGDARQRMGKGLQEKVEKEYSPAAMLSKINSSLHELKLGL